MPSGPPSKRKKAKTPPDATSRVEKGSGNVFADLGLPNPELALAKAKLVRQLRDLISERNLTQAEIAPLLGLDQPKVSALLRGRTDGYSLDRLFRLLVSLGQQVQIRVKPAVAGAESGIVVVA